jgi:HPt (histidine-containing phosphotransfer) domain-containing protein
MSSGDKDVLRPASSSSSYAAANAVPQEACKMRCDLMSAATAATPATKKVKQVNDEERQGFDSDDSNPMSERPRGVEANPDAHDGLTLEEIDEVRNSGAVTGDEEFLWDILETTQQSARDKLKAIELALLDKQWKVASRHCHTIKGSAVMLDLRRLWEAALQGETSLKALDEANEKMDESCQRAVAELRYQIKRLESTKLLRA